MATSWTLIPCLAKLRSEFNEMGPARDRASDGAVGDLAHQQSLSDHNPDETGNVPIRDADKSNEVHAIDIDKDGPWLAGLSMERMVQFILARCRTGKERRLRYIIFNRRIWSASSGWVQKSYSGKNPHDHHAHFSASYNSAQEANRTSWRLADLLPQIDPTPEVPVTSPDANDIAAATAGRDIDPSANRYSWAGADFTTFIRTARIGPMADVVDEIAARVEDQSDALDELTGMLTIIGLQNAEILKRLPEAPAQ